MLFTVLYSLETYSITVVYLPIDPLLFFNIGSTRVYDWQ